MKKSKIVFIWLSLILLIILLLALNYIKFFGNKNTNIEEIPVENSSSTAIENALTEITNNFNQNEKLEEYKKENINLKATLNHYSIYITYSTEETTTTYEFNYSNLFLTIKIENETENIEKFKIIYKLLIEACQKRIGNVTNLETTIDNILNDSKNWEGISKKEEENIITYQLDITKKIEIEFQINENINQ